MKNFSYIERIKNLEAMSQNSYDLVIVGGGINGAGIARDACSRGMNVALVEAQDFAQGTSSRSSKLIHGGIRYLENMEFKLVFEALNERTKLFEIAPHLAHPLRFMIPIFKDSRVGMFKMGLGMWLYDALSLFQAPELHERLNAWETTERLPQLRAQDLTGSFIYSDAYMDDDRLVHETLRSANEMGAVCANFTSALSASFNDDGKIESLNCIDRLTQKKFQLRGKHFVCSTGPWTDLFGGKVFDNWKKILRPTKGVHLTFKKERLPLSSAVVMGAQKSDRIVFGIPRHEMVIVGTTDTDFTGDPADVRVTEEDVKYLLEVVGDYFPGAKLKKSDIVSSYAGVRPLVNDGSSVEGKVSREHTIIDDERGMTIVAGGKYTTYRLMSEEVVGHCLKSFSFEERVKFHQPRTELPLNPYVSAEAWNQARSLSSLWSQKTLRPASECLLLAERYGMEAEQILFDIENLDLSYIQIEAKIAIQKTMCFQLCDFYTRRVPSFLAESDHGVSTLDEVGEVFSALCGWDSAKLESEKAKYLNYIQTELHWKN